MSNLHPALSEYANAVFGDFDKVKNLTADSTFGERALPQSTHDSTPKLYGKAHSILTTNNAIYSLDESDTDVSINDLSSSGPLDDGIPESCHPQIFKSRRDEAWKNLSQHARTKTTPSIQSALQGNEYVNKKANLRINFSSPSTKRTQFNQFNYRDLEDASDRELSDCATIERADIGFTESVHEVQDGQYPPNDTEDIFSVVPRRSVRSHTSQGIPIHKTNEKTKKLLGLQNQIDVENLFASFNNDHADAESLKTELEYYKALSIHLLDRNRELAKVLSENGLSGNGTSMPTPPPSADALQAPWSGTPQLWQTMPELSPDNRFVTTPKTFSASPDPFSPYEQPSPIPQHLLTPQSGKSSRNLKEKTFRHDSCDVSQWHDTAATTTSSYLQGLKMDFAGDAKCNDNFPKVSWTPEGGMGHFVGMPLAHPQPKNTLFSPSMFPPTFFPTYFDHHFGSAIPSQVDRFKKKTLDNNTPLELLVKLALTPDGQEASIRLQQKLKSQDPTQREVAMVAIAPHLHQLAYCRHGNFLVQRAISLDLSLGWTFAETFVKLSLSQYGCHVVQKLLDLGSEDVREMIANELLTEKLEETIASRHAIHIWQKVLDTQWNEAKVRIKIIDTLNSTLRGKWADVAMSETGSLICQNLFESGTASETEECMLEVVERVCECATGQWGVWVVQYIIEHASGEVKKKALSQMLPEAPRLSMSQHGQKAIMTAIRARNPSFLKAYIDVLCEYEVTYPSPEESNVCNHNSPNRRSILVDVATCTHGDQIVTQLLTSATPEQRERLIKTVRKNSVFLKGSKAGLRIYQLCERARAFTGY